MSITFFCPEAPSHHRRVPCDSPTMGLTCTPEERCGYCDDGMMDERVTECPEANFANENALNILSLLGLDRDFYGEISVEAIPYVLRRCMVALARDDSRAHLIEEPRESWGRVEVIEMGNTLARISTGPRVIRMGNTDEQTIRRVTAVRDLLVWAHEHGHKVCWG